MQSFVLIVRDVPHATLYTTDGVKRADRNIIIQDVLDWLENDPMWAARGKAVQGYALLESSLARAMETLGGMPHDTATTIFYKITNTQARNAILEKLLHKKYGNEFNPFWNPFLLALRPVDTRRNEIVHWVAACNAGIDAENVIHGGLTLVPGGSVNDLGSAPTLLTSDLVEFEKKCEDFSRLVTMFAVTSPSLPPGMDAAHRNAWLDIFRQPFVYPLPADHLLFQNS